VRGVSREEAEQLAKRCTKLANDGKPEEAEAVASAELANPDPEVAGHAHNWLGWYFTYTKPSLEQALTHCQKALALLPEWGTAMLNLAYAEDKLGKKVDAYAHYRKCLLYAPHDRELAERRTMELFAERAASLLGARVVNLPAAPDHAMWAVVAPSGAHLVIVRGAFLVNTPSGAALPDDDPEAAAKAVHGSADSEDVTMIEAALAMHDAIKERLGLETVINVPGAGNEFLEAHVRSDAIYVHFGRGSQGVRRKLWGAIDTKLRDVERQVEQHARAPALDARMEKLMRELLGAVQRKTQAPDGAGFRLESFGLVPRTFSLRWGSSSSRHEVARLISLDEGVTLSVGDARTPLDAIDVEQSAEAIAERLTWLTADRLTEGGCYRVLQPFAGQKRGDVVTYDGLDERDNHWNVHVFKTADGSVIEIEDGDIVIRTLEKYLAP
jgi:tetratricopeptide (TPR) repeat protein